MPRRRRARTIWIVAISLVLVGAAVPAAAIVVPSVIEETQPITADGVTPVVLQRDGVEVAFTPGDGWLVHPRFASRAALDLVAPDRALTVELELVPETPEAVVDRLIDAAPDAPASDVPMIDADPGADPDTTDPETADPETGTQAPVRIETLASGLELRHVRAEHRLLAVVDTPSGSVALTVRAGSGVDLDDYRTAIAELLETIEAA